MELLRRQHRKTDERRRSANCQRSGTSIATLQTATFDVVGLPLLWELLFIWCSRTCRDEIATNNQTANYTVQVMEAGLTVVQIGQGTATNSTTGSPLLTELSIRTSASNIYTKRMISMQPVNFPG